MTDPPDAGDFAAKLHRLEALIQQAERLADPVAREHARELVLALLDLHATGLERLLDYVAAAGAAGEAVLDACADDEVVGGLLLLHGLHPLDLDARVRQALEEVGPLLRSRGGGVELLGVDGGVVRLRLEGDGCASSQATVREAVEQAVLARAPDAAAVEIEGLKAPTAGRVALTVL